MTRDVPAMKPASGSSERVYQGIMRELDGGQMVPGQRLAETELAQRYGVGRNAVREAMQRLAVRGIIDLAPYRSPAIRSLDAGETMEILDVARVMTALVAHTAASHYDAHAHAPDLAEVVVLLNAAHASGELGEFARARRQFYRTLLRISGNRELQRLFPAIGMHIVYAQFPSRKLQAIRLADYRRILDAVEQGDAASASEIASEHVETVREIIGTSLRQAPTSS